ncbi:hypothetical protein ACR744_04825 [Bifidobacterium pseudocatenulatum]|uniref:hypothetical protein n=1 Tax=Bifidobacterium pseudocatenulatum TaxID=28026 RepID=UPI003DA5A2A3
MTRGKNRRLRLIPSHLPLIRDKLADFAKYRLGELGSQTQYEAMIANAWSMTDQIRTAQLWWVSRDMTRLAEDTVQAGDFPEPDPPAQCGMIFFEGDVQHISFRFDNDGYGETRVAAILWQDVGRESVKISVFTDNPVGIREMHADLFGLPVVSLAPSVVRENDGSFRWLCGLLRVVWALSAEPHICEEKPAKPDMAHPLPQRFDSEIRKVKMLVLRENLHRPGGSADDDERVRREYSHRFIVRGFWRNQAYGPNHSLRRRQWVPPFVKGPSDKPLICKETVRIWKR